MTDDSKTNIGSDGSIETTNKTIDHIVDALCAVSIVAAVALGNPNATVVGGLVSIALGKRVLKK